MSTEYGVYAPHYNEPGHVRYVSKQIDKPQNEVDALNGVFDVDTYRLVSREVTDWAEVSR
ncbi:MAG: hypothetical protein JJE50_15515 [Actinomycetales bacterium]|nr:hypothetical protein [Actinomycetales bacterium]